MFLRVLQITYVHCTLAYVANDTLQTHSKVLNSLLTLVVLFQKLLPLTLARAYF